MHDLINNDVPFSTVSSGAVKTSASGVDGLSGSTGGSGILFA
jgi:hypothetical protein